MARIPLSTPHLGARERELLMDAFDSTWVGPLGPNLDAFEKEIAQYVGVDHTLALSSGTAALHLAMVVLGVGAGDEVWTSTLTFAATANAICYTGAQPVFVDSEARSWNLDPDLLAGALADAKRRAVLPQALVVVDIYGQCADYQRIEALCEEYGVPLIEDAAEALGADYRGRKAGSFGRLGVLSFNGNKIITCGGGGMLLSDDAELIAKARFLATQAKDPAPHYQHSSIGYNYRLSNLHAAVGRGQLTQLEERVRRRRENYAFYHEALADMDGIDFMPEVNWGRSNRWLTCITIDAEAYGRTREELREALVAQGIEARPVWKPMHLQPIFSECRSIGGQVATDLFERGLCLPSGSNLSEGDLQRVVDGVDSARRSSGKLAAR